MPPTALGPGCICPCPRRCIRLDPIVAILAFYPLADAVSRARGLDPDKPRALRKVTLTT